MVSYVHPGFVLHPGGNNAMPVLLQDLRYALRQLFKAPGFAIAAILSLTLGIAATTAVFSVVWAVVMNPYPYGSHDAPAPRA